MIRAHLRFSALAVLLFAAGFGLAAAQDRINVDELKLRAQAGEKAATRQLADAYYVGKDGVEQDYREAARWYSMLAKQGDARAQTTLGLMYARGYGVKKDAQAAHYWWSFAAAQNDPGAQYNLGLSYASGDGVAQDGERAAQWYAKAAARGHVQAQHNLGMLYHEGRGVARDPLRAYFWVALAARQGDGVARESLKSVSAGLSREQIGRAEEQVEEWFTKAKKLWQ